MLRAARPMQPYMQKNLGIERMQVCFCGCPDGKHFGKSLSSAMNRRGFSSFHDKLNINDATNLIPAEFKTSD